MDFSVDRKMVHAGTGGVEFDAAKPTIVFIHGASMDHTIWALQGRYLAHHGYSVLAIDLPGHGSSNGPALESIEQMSDWIASAIKATTTNPVTIVGHSMGAIVALETAAQNPEKIAAMALAGAAVPMNVHHNLLTQTRDEPSAAIDSILTWAYGRRAQIGGTRVPGLWMLGGGRRLIERNAGEQLHIDFKACSTYLKGRESASKVSCPTLIIVGNDDRMTPPKAANNLQQAIPHSQTVFIQGSGHMMMIEYPDQTLDVLRDFLQTTIPLGQDYEGE